MTEIQELLASHRDPGYAEFIRKLVPNVSPDRFLGVRTPEYKKIIKELPDEETVSRFLGELPHFYFEENVLHSALLGKIRDFDECLRKVEEFVPYIDNWAVNDGLNPAVFKKHRPELKPRVRAWIADEAPFTKRFGLHILMSHFLLEDFDPSLLELAAGVRSEEYYVNMMTAWLFAEALTKQWDTAVKYIEDRRLDPWTHQKAIQKAVESYRIPEEQKAYLRSLRIGKHASGPENLP